MEIVWTDKAKERLKENLEFWDIHNGTPSFSDKILLEIQRLMFELSNNPIFLGRYNKDLNLYVRAILKGRYLVYFQVKSEDNREYIEIQYFLSSKQKQLF
ncbi:type II toxin-antitoxin system RelE/ParE family toxin [Capnocytophaga sp. Marseille-Q4570]|jgi:hypothetical protein|uniref:Type II toxin-antitoxin system RelE/ParE family toxin n=1 Tax=Capnocytophaga bilenii TaxID=2819369 RepID=A0ABS3PVG7_9FLAO|nr:type II toxin-antitoxin system RelE/ParE family toxin [Capnocytophaga bilenii]MBO1883321.1 type II toxin-antitoxin system RelE/ParE family toxin [Capnocytophaga bilenii]